MGLRIGLLFVVLVVALVLTLTLIYVINRPEIKSVGWVGLGAVNKLTPVGIDVPIYVVGSSLLIQRLVDVGVNQSLIKPLLTTKPGPTTDQSMITMLLLGRLSNWAIVTGLISN